MKFKQKYSDDELKNTVREFFKCKRTYEAKSYREYSFGRDVASIDTIKNRFGSWGNVIDEVGIPHRLNRCPEKNCKNYYLEIGKHWNFNPNHRPDINNKQHRILKGLVMGDGCVVDKNNYCHLQCEMTTPNFLHWLDEQFGCLGIGVRMTATEEESARRTRENGFSSNAKVENYQKVYVWKTTPHPEIDRYRKEWYPNGDKRFVDGLELEPLSLKVWYCGDGSKAEDYTSDGRPKFSISCTNEKDRKGNIRDAFERLGWSPTFRDNRDYGIKEDRVDFYFSVNESEEIWNWIGEPLPGFKYKWPTEKELERKNKQWSTNEISILKEKYPENGTFITEIKRSRYAIRAKANELGIKNQEWEKRYL